MSNLKVIAKELLNKNNKTELNYNDSEVILSKKLINIEYKVYRNIFNKKIEKELENFQFNLLRSVNEGKSLQIEIFTINKNEEQLSTYYPISEKIIEFINDTNFELISDNMINNHKLQELYNLIRNNDIYPQWKIYEEEEETTLYLEIDPLVGFNTKQEELKAKEEDYSKREANALIAYNKNINEIKSIKRFSYLKKSLLMFLSVLYISVGILTVLSSILGAFPIESLINLFGLNAIAWPYYIFSDTRFFVFSFPIGLVFSLYLTFQQNKCSVRNTKVF